jgi:transposase
MYQTSTKVELGGRHTACLAATTPGDPLAASGHIRAKYCQILVKLGVCPCVYDEYIASDIVATIAEIEPGIIWSFDATMAQLETHLRWGRVPSLGWAATSPAGCLVLPAVVLAHLVDAGGSPAIRYHLENLRHAGPFTGSNLDGPMQAAKYYLKTVSNPPSDLRPIRAPDQVRGGGVLGAGRRSPHLQSPRKPTVARSQEAGERRGSPAKNAAERARDSRARWERSPSPERLSSPLEPVWPQNHAGSAQVRPDIGRPSVAPAKIPVVERPSSPLPGTPDEDPDAGPPAQAPSRLRRQTASSPGVREDSPLRPAPAGSGAFVGATSGSHESAWPGAQDTSRDSKKRSREVDVHVSHLDADKKALWVSARSDIYDTLSVGGSSSVIHLKDAYGLPLDLLTCALLHIEATRAEGAEETCAPAVSAVYESRQTLEEAIQKHYSTAEWESIAPTIYADISDLGTADIWLLDAKLESLSITRGVHPDVVRAAWRETNLPPDLRAPAPRQLNRVERFLASRGASQAYPPPAPHQSNRVERFLASRGATQAYTPPAPHQPNSIETLLEAHRATEAYTSPWPDQATQAHTSQATQAYTAPAPRIAPAVPAVYESRQTLNEAIQAHYSMAEWERIAPTIYADIGDLRSGDVWLLDAKLESLSITRGVHVDVVRAAWRETHPPPVPTAPAPRQIAPDAAPARRSSEAAPPRRSSEAAQRGQESVAYPASRPRIEYGPQITPEVQALVDRLEPEALWLWDVAKKAIAIRLCSMTLSERQSPDAVIGELAGLWSLPPALIVAYYRTIGTVA